MFDDDVDVDDDDDYDDDFDDDDDDHHHHDDDDYSEQCSAARRPHTQTTAPADRQHGHPGVIARGSRVDHNKRSHSAQFHHSELVGN